MEFSVKGRRNNDAPVTLFRTVCTDIILLFRMNPQVMLPTLMTAIAMTQIHNHVGTWIIGRNLIRATIANTMSATVSNRAPNSLALFVLLATAPSAISVKPQRRYRVQNWIEDTGGNSIRMLHRMRQPVMAFAICPLNLIPPTQPIPSQDKNVKRPIRGTESHIMYVPASQERITSAAYPVLRSHVANIPKNLWPLNTATKSIIMEAQT